MIDRIRDLRVAGITFSLSAVLISLSSFIALALPLKDNIGYILWPQISVAISVIIGVKISGKGFKEVLSMNKPRISDLLYSAGMGIVSIPAALYLAMLVMLIIEVVFGQTMLSSALSTDNMPPYLSIIMMSLMPALFEESLFRGVVFRGLKRNYSATKAIVLSAIIFGLFHMDFQRLIGQALIGAVCAYVVYRSKSIFTGITVHFVYNGALTLSSILFPSEELDATGEYYSAGVLQTIQELAAEQNIPMPMAIAAYILMSVLIISISLGLVALLLHFFRKGTQNIQEDESQATIIINGELTSEAASTVEENNDGIQADSLFSWDEPFIKKKRKEAWLLFIPAFAIILLSNVLTALMLLGVIAV